MDMEIGVTFDGFSTCVIVTDGGVEGDLLSRQHRGVVSGYKLARDTYLIFQGVKDVLDLMADLIGTGPR